MDFRPPSAGPSGHPYPPAHAVHCRTYVLHVKGFCSPGFSLHFSGKLQAHREDDFSGVIYRELAASVLDDEGDEGRWRTGEYRIGRAEGGLVRMGLLRQAYQDGIEAGGTYPMAHPAAAHLVDYRPAHRVVSAAYPDGSAPGALVYVPRCLMGFDSRFCWRADQCGNLLALDAIVIRSFAPDRNDPLVLPISTDIN